jgi:LPPG:FO 2-phospho-L-lactate transferase
MRLAALAGGVGGAKLVDGLAQLLYPKDLSIIVNTADDFNHLGLYISPDIDTVCYTLAGLSNRVSGWGRDLDTFEVLANLQKIGGPVWFRIGDKDIATHLERTRRLEEGRTLTQITRDFSQAWGINHAVLPMSDQSVRTVVDTVEMGELPFQEYFVRLHCQPRVKGFRFAGIESAQPSPEVINAIERADVIVLCPSNPWVSIDPILALTTNRLFNRKEGTRGNLMEQKRVVAISPIIRGQTIKGPAAKMYTEMGITPSALAVADHYKGLISDFFIDNSDAALANNPRLKGIRVHVTNTIMRSIHDRRQLAQDVLHFIDQL